MIQAPPDLLRAMFDAAVAAALPDRCVPQHLPPSPRGRTVVVGAGKASAAMARAMEAHWPRALSGLVVTRYGHAVQCNGSRSLRPRIRCRTSPARLRRAASWNSCRA